MEAFRHYLPGELASESVQSFIEAASAEWPDMGGVGLADTAAYAKKLSERAEVLVWGEWAAAIFFYCNDPERRAAYVTFFAKRRAIRGSVGLALHQAMVDRVVGLGFAGVELEVGLRNELAIRFYRRLGYVEVERRADSLIMGLSL